MLPRLTPELIDITIDYLYSDKLTLSACSLTCKEWLPSSRYHLFSEVSFSPTNVDSLLDGFEISSNSPSNVLGLIRGVKITSFSMYNVRNHVKYEDVKKLLGCCLDFLSNVTFVRVCHGDFISQKILSKLPNVRELVLENLYVSSMDKALDMVYAFPKLQNLSMDRVQWLGADISPEHPKLGSLSLIREARLENYEMKGFTAWVLALDPLPALHTLSYNAFDPDNRAESRLKFLASVGPSIQSIELSFERCSNISEGKHIPKQ